MSGFEVVGVVLGAIPIIITVIQKYRPIWKYTRELRALQRGLEVEHLVLQGTCERLLIKTIAIKDIKALISDPFGPLWKKQAIHRSVRLRLWNSYDVFEETVHDMSRVVNELAEKLGLDLSTQVRSSYSHPKKSLTQHQTQRADHTKNDPPFNFERIRYIIRRSQFEGLLKTLADGNATLTKLLNTGIDHAVEDSRQSQSRDRALKLTRQSSQSAFYALVSSISCSCRNGHNLGLKLPHSSMDYPTPVDSDVDIVKNTTFEVTFALDSAKSNGKSTASNWEGLQLHTHNWDPKQLSNPEVPLIKTEPKEEDETKLSWLKLGRHQNTNANAQRQSVQSTSCSAVIQEPHTLKTEHGLKAITNLCHELYQFRNGAPRVDSYGLITSDSSLSKHIFRVVPSSFSKTLSTRFDNTLEALLQSQSGQLPKIRFRHKHILAAALVSSVLQISSSQWFPDLLTSADIIFMDQSGECLLEHPFIQKRLADSKQAIQDTKQAGSAIPHRSVLSVGIVLLEVALGRALNTSGRTTSSPNVKTDSDLLTDYETAIQLLDQVEKEVGPNYGQAVRRCIKGEFMSPNLDLEDDDFRTEFYNKVVALLEQNVAALHSV
jgi:hypothetical protein